jgi:hypothetical protein
LSSAQQLSWAVPDGAGFLCDNAIVIAETIKKHPVLLYAKIYIQGVDKKCRENSDRETNLRKVTLKIH